MKRWILDRMRGNDSVGRDVRRGLRAWAREALGPQAPDDRTERAERSACADGAPASGSRRGARALATDAATTLP